MGSNFWPLISSVSIVEQTFPFLETSSRVARDTHEFSKEEIHVVSLLYQMPISPSLEGESLDLHIEDLGI